jgi:hypothetical protein
MREKVTASLIFKDRKSSYPRRYDLSCIIWISNVERLKDFLFKPVSMYFGKFIERCSKTPPGSQFHLCKTGLRVMRMGKLD